MSCSEYLSTAYLNIPTVDHRTLYTSSSSGPPLQSHIESRTATHSVSRQSLRVRRQTRLEPKLYWSLRSLHRWRKYASQTALYASTVPAACRTTSTGTNGALVWANCARAPKTALADEADARETGRSSRTPSPSAAINPPANENNAIMIDYLKI